MPGQLGSEEDRRRAIIEELRGHGVVRGVLVQMAKDGQILEVRCELPECYCPNGRVHFAKKSHPPTKWMLTPDHYPILKSANGKLTSDNVRLAHSLCNGVNYGWRKRIGPMLRRSMSLEEIAAELNRKKVKSPHGTNKWSPATVREAFVS